MWPTKKLEMQGFALNVLKCGEKNSLKSWPTHTSFANIDYDELVAVAEGILGQRVTWEGFMGREGDECTV